MQELLARANAQAEKLAYECGTAKAEAKEYKWQRDFWHGEAQGLLRENIALRSKIEELQEKYEPEALPQRCWCGALATEDHHGAPFCRAHYSMVKDSPPVDFDEEVA